MNGIIFVGRSGRKIGGSIQIHVELKEKNAECCPNTPLLYLPINKYGSNQEKSSNSNEIKINQKIPFKKGFFIDQLMSSFRSL
jgi:hypothetical protein